MTQSKRLIELSLPLKAISAQSAREKSIRHGHISTLHIWWARRPLAAMRAAIFASLIPAPDTDAERQRLKDLIATIVDWDQVKDGNSPAIEKAQDLIRQAFPDRPPRLPDRAGRTASVIDVLHRAATLWESGEHEGLAEFLAEGARGREDQVRLVAQTLINVLPDEDAERRLLEGFLAGRDMLPEVPRQERLL